MEKLFNAEQLQTILDEATNGFDTYFDGYVLDGDAIDTSIITISKERHLIFTEGNEDTGFRHLSDRHSYFSRRHYWRLDDQNEYKLDKPSKFYPGFMPMIDYVNIADEICRLENKNTTVNHKTNLFDKYTGEYCHEKFGSEKYHVLTYKDTMIVHTLFPDKKKHNPKFKCLFARGPVSETLKYPEGINDLFVPFLDHTDSIRFSITIRRYYGQLMEHLIISEHDDTGEVLKQYLIGEREHAVFKRFEREDMHNLQHADISEFEQMINSIYQQKISEKEINS